MNFLNKTTTGMVAKTFLRLTIILSWFVANVLLYKVFMSFQLKRRHNGFFQGYERVGKTFGSALLFFGNIGLYYFSEKSIACMLTFLFLAFYCLCSLFCVQPYTDFGVFEFLVGASLNESLSVFGIHSYSSWLVLIACIVMAGLRYWLEPTTIGNSKFEKEELDLLRISQEKISRSRGTGIKEGFRISEDIWRCSGIEIQTRDIEIAI